MTTSDADTATRPPSRIAERHMLLIGIALVFLAPFFSMLSASLRNERHSTSDPDELLPRAEYIKRPNGEWREVLDIASPPDLSIPDNHPSKISVRIGNWSGRVDKYVSIRPDELVTRTGPVPSNFIRPFVANRFGWVLCHTLIISVICALAVTSASALAAYSFSILNWMGRDAVFYLALATLILPASLTVLPMYGMHSAFGWSETFMPTLLPALCGNAFLIYLLRRYFLKIPRDLLDAARMEGSSEWKIFTRLVLPISTPVLTVALVLAFVWHWNDSVAAKFCDYILRLEATAMANESLPFTLFTDRCETMAVTLLMMIPPAAILFFTRKQIFAGVCALLPERAVRVTQ